MRTIIAGSRGITDPVEVERAVANCGWTPTTIISGGARGVDRLGEHYAELNGLKLEIYEADWNKYGRYKAGHIRNIEMAKVADALIAVWDGISGGTGHMIDTARRFNLKVYVHLV